MICCYTKDKYPQTCENLTPCKYMWNRSNNRKPDDQLRKIRNKIKVRLSRTIWCKPREEKLINLRKFFQKTEHAQVVFLFKNKIILFYKTTKIRNLTEFYLKTQICLDKVIVNWCCAKSLPKATLLKILRHVFNLWKV